MGKQFPAEEGAHSRTVVVEEPFMTVQRYMVSAESRCDGYSCWSGGVEREFWAETGQCAKFDRVRCNQHAEWLATRRVRCTQ